MSIALLKDGLKVSGLYLDFFFVYTKPLCLIVNKQQTNNGLNTFQSQKTLVPMFYINHVKHDSFQ